MGKRREQDQQVAFRNEHEAIPAPRTCSPLEAKSTKQRLYINAIKNFQLTFGTGPAGTGKTYIAVALAAQAILNREIEQLIITRPAVEAGEKLGFLPGEIEEKFDPYLVPVRDVLNERLGKGFTEYLIKSGKIMAAPLAYMRGRTFKDSFVILDEAQNTTPVQMKMFLTRIGINTRVVVNGDLNQQDIHGMSGFADAINRCGHIPAVKIINFTRDDIVRSGLCSEIVIAYDNPAPTSSYVL